jgi:uncharacterized protein (TIGR03437 family)
MKRTLTNTAVLLCFLAMLGRAEGARLPYAFEQNVGQSDPLVKFLARGNKYTHFLTERETVLVMGNRVVRMSLAGSHAPAQIKPLEPFPFKTNYFIGSSGYNVPNFSRVRYRSVYDGIDLEYHSQEGQMEYDFIVAPGVSSSSIGLIFSGADQTSVDGNGQLVLKIGNGKLIHRRPVAYQNINGHRVEVAASYVMRNGDVGFDVAEYDRSRTLVIDPVVVYSSFVGGDRSDSITGVAVDKAGNTYITGETTSANFPQVGTNHTQLQGALTYAFVTKINPAGNQILYSTFLGGSSNTRGRAITVDADGNAYIGGVTGARNFPLVNPVQSEQKGLNIGFVTKLSAEGDKILFSTFNGGERNDEIDAIAVDSSNNIYAAGRATSTQIPTVNAFQPAPAGSTDVLVAKYTAPNYRLAYNTYMGGAAVDEAYGIAADAQGNAYLTGFTISQGIATTGAYQTKYGGSNDAFVAKIRPDGSGLVFFTYLGGNGDDRAQALTLGRDGSIWVTGSTVSTNWPVSENAAQKAFGGSVDAFVTQMDANGTRVMYSTYLGGSGRTTSYAEEGRGIALNSQGNVVVAGTTNSTDFPVERAVQTFGGAQDGFVTEIDPVNGRIVYSSPLGGSATDIGHAVAVDATDAVIVGGETLSANFPMKGALRTTFAGGSEAFLTKICDPRVLTQPSSLTFIYTPGGTLPAAQTLNVSACTTISFSAAAGNGFVKLGTTSGMTNASIQVTADPAGLAPGDYPSTITITAPDAVNSPYTMNVMLRVAPPAPAISAAGIVNAASGKGGPVAPGELLVIYGSNLGPKSLVGLSVEAGKVTSDIQGTKVLFDGVAAPLVYASSGQVSAIVPYSVASKSTVRVELEANGIRSNAVDMSIAAASPALFTANSSGSGPGAILNQDSSVNTPDNPAARGSIVVLFATGEGQTDPGGVDGQLALITYPKPVLPARVTIDGQAAEVLYAGAAPGMVAGVMQLNVRVPDSARAGNVPVQTTIGSVTSPAGVTLAVR